MRKIGNWLFNKIMKLDVFGAAYALAMYGIIGILYGVAKSSDLGFLLFLGCITFLPALAMVVIGAIDLLIVSITVTIDRDSFTKQDK